MTIYIFPIFMFGLLITGIIYLGISQAVEWAKQDAVRKQLSEDLTVRLGAVPPQPVVTLNGMHHR